MVSNFTGNPKVQKGALAVYDAQTAGTQPSRIIVFQYNADQVRRSYAHRAPPPPPGNAGAARQDQARAAGPPVETINLSLELDATDQLEHPNQNQQTAEHGLHPALATLELLMFQKTAEARRAEQQAGQGAVQVAPAELPLVLLVWGRSRIVPVDLTSFAVTEEAFDTKLNPIHAKVELGLKVLTEMELPADSIGRDAYSSYLEQKRGFVRDAATDPRADGIRTILPGARTQ